jgi:signal transduction histidine kinase/HAMP domain-containing protein/CheY-like chemotaxis protein
MSESSAELSWINRVKQFSALHNRLIFYTTLQILFVIIVVLGFSGLMVEEYQLALARLSRSGQVAEPVVSPDPEGSANELLASALLGHVSPPPAQPPEGPSVVPPRVQSGPQDPFWSRLVMLRLLTLALGIGLAVFMACSISRPIIRLAKKSQAILDGNLSVAIEEVPQQDEIAVLNNTISRMVKRLVDKNANLESLILARTRELHEINQRLKEKEDTLLAQNEELRVKENLLTLHNEELATQEEELTQYVRKLSEQQERDRLVKWIVTSIRESLDLEQVLLRTVREVGRLIQVDRCYIALYHVPSQHFSLQQEFKATDAIPSQSGSLYLLNQSEAIRQQLCRAHEPVVITNLETLALEPQLTQYLASQGVKSVVKIPLVHNNQVLGALCVNQLSYYRSWREDEVDLLQDIAQQVAIALRQAQLYQEAQEATRLKSEFLANMSHEFRTPLNAIIGFSEMIASRRFGELTPKQADYVQNVIHSGRHLLTLVNDILDLSKIESGNMEMHYELFDLPQVFMESVNVLQGLAFQKSITLGMHLDRGVHYGYSDPARLKQILLNLMSNALKFTPTGGKVTLNAYVLDHDPKTLVVDVSDTGIGIDEAHREVVFSQFQQVDASYARLQEGSGLGLALTRKLVTLQGGTLDFVSQVNMGTTFTVMLPCHVSQGWSPRAVSSTSGALAPVEAAVDQASAHTWPDASRARLAALAGTAAVLSAEASEGSNQPHLVIGAPSLDRHLALSQAFYADQYRISHIMDLNNLLTHLEQLTLPDLVILDLGMGETARTLARSLKEHPKWGGLPVLFGLGEKTPGAAISGMGSLGVIDYLFEPLSEARVFNHFENIRQNIIKETELKVLFLGTETLARLFSHEHWPFWSHYQHHYRFHFSQLPTVLPPDEVDWTAALEPIFRLCPDVIVLECPPAAPHPAFSMLAHLKSHIETKYIPVIMIETASACDAGPQPPLWALSSGASVKRGGGTALLTAESAALPLTRCAGNLVKDVEYALRMNKGRNLQP